MSIFAKDWRKVLEKHIRLLEHFGLLKLNWKWDRNKVRILDKIDRLLIRDLIKLHDSHQQVGQNLPALIALLKRLDFDLREFKGSSNFKSMEKDEQERLQELIINVDRILEEQKELSHLTPAEKELLAGEFKKDFAKYSAVRASWKGEGTEPKYPTATLRKIKKLWNERIDRRFMQRVKTVHWCSKSSCDYLLLNYPSTAKMELSCNGYLRTPYKSQFHYGLGLLVKGWVTFAANTDLAAVYAEKARGPTRKYSKGETGLILNKSTFDISPKGRNEFLVANWKPVGLILDLEHISKTDVLRTIKDTKEDYGTYSVRLMISSFVRYAHAHKINLYDVKERIIYDPESTSFFRRFFTGIKGIFSHV